MHNPGKMAIAVHSCVPSKIWVINECPKRAQVTSTEWALQLIPMFYQKSMSNHGMIPAKTGNHHFFRWLTRMDVFHGRTVSFNYLFLLGSIIVHFSSHHLCKTNLTANKQSNAITHYVTGIWLVTSFAALSGFVFLEIRNAQVPRKMFYYTSNWRY